MEDEKAREALFAKITNYRETLTRIVFNLEKTLRELDSLPPLFNSDLYCSGTWQTTVDISVAIKKFNWLIDFLENPTSEYLNTYLVLLPELGEDNGI